MCQPSLRPLVDVSTPGYDVGVAEPWLSDREQEVWRSFLRMHQLLRVRVEQELQQASGLSESDYSVLAALSEAPGQTLRMAHLGRGLMWEKSRLHHQLSRMCARGLVRREESRSDGGARAIEAVLTPEGRAAVEAAAPAHARHVRRYFFAPLSEEELTHLEAISTKVADSLAAGCSEAPPEDGSC
jgi:DNA-binding MarR family transcriptional regulator